MGYDNDAMTAHGFRAMARTILDDLEVQAEAGTVVTANFGKGAN